MAKRKTIAEKVGKQLLKAAMSYPEAFEDFPWGGRAIKVRKKIFLGLNFDAEGLSCSMKLPESRYEALTLPFTEPTHYGMGKHGWVTAKFEANEDIPADILEDWIDESFRAIAPKGLVKELDEEG